MARRGAGRRPDASALLHALAALVRAQLTPEVTGMGQGVCAMSGAPGRPRRGTPRPMMSTDIGTTTPRGSGSPADPGRASGKPDDEAEDRVQTGGTQTGDTQTGGAQTGDTGTGDTVGVDDTHADSWRLVAAAKTGDGEAFGKLYDRYVDMVYRFIYYRVNDRGLAEDFTSETFLRALRRIHGFTYQGRDIGAWFITIARNIVFDHTKSARHRLEITTGEVPEGDDVAGSPESAVVASFTSQFLLDAIRKLNDEQRECITLRFIEGFSVSETAEAMGKNDGAIKALQHRAVKKLALLVGGELR